MFAPHIGDEAEKMTTLAGSAAKPAENRQARAQPADPDHPALRTAYPGAGDVPIPARPRKRAEFPYYNEPNTGI